MRKLASLFLMLGLIVSASLPKAVVAAPEPSLDHIIQTAPASDWRTLDPDDLLFMRLGPGVVVIELAPAFAPNHVANIKRLARAGFYNGLFIVRAQDNYVVQWGDADAKRPTGGGRMRLKAEFDHVYRASEAFTPLPDPDTYAPSVGFTGDFPAARDPSRGLAWLTHCYGMVGAGRDVDADSGGGPELYAVTGQAPRQLDRNVTLVGRVIQGIDILSGMPRGHGDLGFYQSPAERTPILSIRVGSDVPASLRGAFQVLKTDSPSFQRIIDNRRFRKDDWYKTAAGRIDICNIAPPVRSAQ